MFLVSLQFQRVHSLVPVSPQRKDQTTLHVQVPVCVHCQLSVGLLVESNLTCSSRVSVGCNHKHFICTLVVPTVYQSMVSCDFLFVSSQVWPHPHQLSDKKSWYLIYPSQLDNCTLKLHVLNLQLISDMYVSLPCLKCS